MFSSTDDAPLFDSFHLNVIPNSFRSKKVLKPELFGAENVNNTREG